MDFEENHQVRTLLGIGPNVEEWSLFPQAICKILNLYLYISYDVTKVHNPIIKYRGSEKRGLVDFISKKVVCIKKKLYY